MSENNMDIFVTETWLHDKADLQSITVQTTNSKPKNKIQQLYDIYNL